MLFFHGILPWSFANEFIQLVTLRTHYHFFYFFTMLNASICICSHLTAKEIVQVWAFDDLIRNTLETLKWCYIKQNRITKYHTISKNLSSPNCLYVWLSLGPFFVNRRGKIRQCKNGPATEGLHWQKRQHFGKLNCTKRVCSRHGRHKVHRVSTTQGVLTVWSLTKKYAVCRC